jgi:hypothetical protein
MVFGVGGWRLEKGELESKDSDFWREAGSVGGNKRKKRKPEISEKVLHNHGVAAAESQQTIISATVHTSGAAPGSFLDNKSQPSGFSAKSPENFPPGDPRRRLT